MVGIGGAGMSGIARVLREQGVRVSGSDLNTNGITDQLEKIGVTIYRGHSASNLEAGVNLVVISSAIPADNVEVTAAKAKDIPVIRRGQMLARMVNEHLGLAVAGAHGKTTTTSMLYSALVGCGLDPTMIVGGEIQGTQLHARLGANDYFVVEADESDASFLEIKPYAAIVTNIENDHLDFYQSMDRLQAAFRQFLGQIMPAGFAMVYGGDPLLLQIRDDLPTRILTYGESGDRLDYYFDNWVPEGMGSSFEVYRGTERLGLMKLSIPGKHNALNAVAAAAVAVEIGQDFSQVAKALQAFPGAKRRFQIMARVKGVTIVDDYAHHPTEIKATIRGARQFHQDRLVVIFQPHRYSRTQLLYKQFGEAFREADLVIITDIYSAGENAIENVTGELIYQAAVAAGCNARYIPALDDAEAFLKDRLENNDLLITMGAGDVWKTGVKLAEKL
ncbi:MAG: UDP-N-acetylmuramate--L-alanine ligase [Syntrophomonadaceae bacterium]